MPRATRAALGGVGADAAGAIMASGKNPDATDYTLPVSGTVTATGGAQPGAANINAGQATAGVASGELVAARATRRSVTIRNLSAGSVWIGEGTVTAINGFLLETGESMRLNTTAAINGIRDTTDAVVSFIEEYD